MSELKQQTYHYQRHEPEKTTLYKIIQANWLTFQEQVQYDMGYPLPDFVIKEFEEYLRCGVRRMSETAAHLVDNVLPHKNIRQWVLTFPVPIRLCLAVRSKLMARALDIAHLMIGQYYRKKANLKSTNSKSGAVTLIQRFGGSLNLNIHFHQLFVDGGS